MNYFVLCGTPRTGSTHLARLLEKNGLGPSPEAFNEFLGLPFGDAIMQGESTEDYAAKAFASRTDRFVGVKLFTHNLAWMLASSRAHFSTDTLLPAIFPRAKYVFVQRRDKIAQAISTLRALHDRQWQWEVNGARPKERPCPNIDPQALHYSILSILKAEREWPRFFSAVGIAPMNVLYDDLCENPHRVLQAVGRFIAGPEFEVRTTEAALVIQRDGQSERIKQEYLSRKGAFQVRDGRSEFVTPENKAATCAPPAS